MSGGHFFAFDFDNYDYFWDDEKEWKNVERKSRKGRNYLMILVKKEMAQTEEQYEWVRSQEVVLNKWFYVTQPFFT